MKNIVEGIKIAFYNIFDKGYHVNLPAWRAERQQVSQPTFARKNKKFTGRQTIQSADIMTDCLGNEQAIFCSKMSGYIKKGVRKKGLPWLIDNTWLVWSFSRTSCMKLCCEQANEMNLPAKKEQIACRNKIIKAVMQMLKCMIDCHLLFVLKNVFGGVQRGLWGDAHSIWSPQIPIGRKKRFLFLLCALYSFIVKLPGVITVNLHNGFPLQYQLGILFFLPLACPTNDPIIFIIFCIFKLGLKFRCLDYISNLLLN